ncbi:MAG: hypothetical protein NUV82_03795 [Candidatus Komeilibacteria bacterium]|nr:hypothetical protein [Candidatus Komeilibacteria bacterium]
MNDDPIYIKVAFVLVSSFTIFFIWQFTLGFVVVGLLVSLVSDLVFHYPVNILLVYLMELLLWLIIAIGLLFKVKK